MKTLEIEEMNYSDSNYSIKKKVLTTWMIVLINLSCYGQQYLPISIYTPQFNNQSVLQTELGINNFGLNYSLGVQFKRMVATFHYEYSNASIYIDPLKVNGGSEANQIQSIPFLSNYFEASLGYNLKIPNQKLSTYIGVGNHLSSNNWRYFVQLDWGNENDIIDAGVSMRGSYTKASSLDLFNPHSLIPKTIFVFSPSIFGKLKLWKLYIKKQFGYAIILNENGDSLQPLFTLGQVQ